MSLLSQFIPKYLLYSILTTLFNYTIAFAQENSNCNSEMQLCLKKVDQRYGDSFDPERQTAISNCGLAFNECEAIAKPEVQKADDNEKNNFVQKPDSEQRIIGQTNEIEKCFSEIQERVLSCNSSASDAVAKCDPKQENSESNSLSLLRDLLLGVSSVMGVSSVESCTNAAIASSSGYYALEDLSEKCNSEIKTCKTTCNQVSSYIKKNKEMTYQSCRKKAFEDHKCAVNSRYKSSTEDEFNIEWDAVNKGAYDEQIRHFQTITTEHRTTCTSGTATANKRKVSESMKDMDRAVKNANKCRCQLSSSKDDCDKLAGPAECKKNPNLPGCTMANYKCFSLSDTSKECVCLKNPNGNECKKINSSGIPKETRSSEVSSFSSVTEKATDFNPQSISPNSDRSNDNNLGAFNSLDESLKTLAASETVGAENVSIGSSAPGTSPNGAGDSGGESPQKTDLKSAEEIESNRPRNLFSIAASAVKSLFNRSDTSKGKSKNFMPDVFERKSDLNGNKWRPKGMVRGIASEKEFAGKFEDIFSVMNRQYKYQDQKNNFIYEN